VKVAASRVQVPVNALLFRAEGLRAVVIDANHKTHLRQLTIGRDYGTSLEVLQGLESTDWIVLNPADSLDEGQEVRVKQVAQADASGAPAQASPSKAPNANASAAPGARR
jgi:membrane fusion protein, multidrug efflux system